VSGSAASLLEAGEKLYSPAAAAKASTIPGHRGGAHLNGSTIFRHITKGVRAANGELIRLEAARVGGRWLTSLEAIARFSAKLTDAALHTDDTPPTNPPTPAARTRAASKASKELDAILGANS
jgi:hypothetical protein